MVIFSIENTNWSKYLIFILVRREIFRDQQCDKRFFSLLKEKINKGHLKQEEKYIAVFSLFFLLSLTSSFHVDSNIDISKFMLVRYTY